MTRSSVLASLVVLAPAASAGVVTVGPSGADHAQIADAVAAAVDGDVILVRSGNYQGFVIDGKAITVVGDAGTAITVNTTVRVANLASTQTVVLSGIDSMPLFTGTPLVFENNDGRIRVQSVNANGPQWVFGGAWPAVQVTNCDDVSFAGCAFVGGRAEFGGQGWSHPGQPALVASASVVTMYDCSATGAHGLYGYTNPPFTITAGAPGRPGVELSNQTSFFVRGSTFVGGNGGNGNSTDACPTNTYAHDTAGGDGAPGILATGSSVTFMDLDATGGTGGVGGTNGCGGQAPSGAAAGPIVPPLVILPDAPVAMQVVEPAREGGLLTFQLSGPSGHRVLLGTSPNAGLSVVSSGNLLLGAPMRRIPLGTIPASGTLTVQLPVPALPAAVEARVLHAQAVFVDPIGGQSRVATPSVLVMLDAAF